MDFGLFIHIATVNQHLHVLHDYFPYQGRTNTKSGDGRLGELLFYPNYFKQRKTIGGFSLCFAFTLYSLDYKFLSSFSASPAASSHTSESTSVASKQL